MTEVDRIIAALEKERNTLRNEGHVEAALALDTFIKTAAPETIVRLRDMIVEARG